MEQADDLFREIEHTALHATDAASRYRRLNRLLERVVADRASTLTADFTHSSARLHALCRLAHLNPYPIELFRANARRVQRGEYAPRETDFRYDLKALCEAVSAFYGAPVPAALQALLPARWRTWQHPAFAPAAVRRIRLTVCRWDDRFLYGHDADHPTEVPLKVLYANEGDDTFAALNRQLYEGAQVNLLTVRSEAGVLHPEAVVLDPDFLIDITALCACLKPYGTTPLAHLLHKFLPAPRSEAICLGNTANQFLDDCVNESGTEANEDEETLYRRSMQKSFRQAPLTFTTLPGIDRSFFEKARTQFANIRRTVKEKFSAADIDIEKAAVQLEPSFLCEALGLQGRMDLLVNDFSKIVELKSGKACEFPQLRPREEHALQMALYQEILYHNKGVRRSGVQTFLFYSHYPLFYNIRVPRADIRRALALRNAIVHQERMLRGEEGRAWLASLREADFNVNGRADAFYRNYLQADIRTFLRTVQQADALTAAYFHTFLSFLEREQLLAKTGDGHPDSARGFADTWNSDAATRMANGTLLPHLRLHPVQALDGSIDRLTVELPAYDDDFLPNFRPGDAVMLYERNREEDDVTGQQFFRCSIEAIHPHEMQLRLAYPQRNARVFHTESRYALEPAHMDATFAQAYRGLYALLTAPAERRDLLLGRRAPERDTDVTLNGRYADAETAAIVRQAKQARDYFLLVGPPGTGKTSVALKAMVKELLTDTPPRNLLVMAYTNRAVDEICEMLERISPAPAYVRIGQELCCDARFRPRLLKHVTEGADSRRALHDTLAPIRLFTGTIASVTACPELFALRRFDTALIDEASQVLEPQLLPLLCATTPLPTDDFGARPCAIGRFILIGDHKQLPAVVQQPPSQSRVSDEQLHAIGLTDCRNSLFERLHRLQERRGTPGIVAMLHRQGRMHPALSEFVNRNYYGGRLEAVPLPHQTAPPDFAAYAGTDEWLRYVATTRMGFLPVASTPWAENNKVNRAEACLIARLVQAVHDLCQGSGTPFRANERIGIIVPFRGQIAMIRKELATLGMPDAEAITIDTVERYQGSQRDIILFSTTVSQPYQLDILSAPTATDDGPIDRKLNVALTRARKQFFLTGDDALLRRSAAYARLLDYIESLAQD